MFTLSEGQPRGKRGGTKANAVPRFDNRNRRVVEQGYPDEESLVRIVKKQDNMVAETGYMTKEMGDSTTQLDHEYQNYGQKRIKRPPRTWNNFRHALLAWPDIREI